VIRWLAFAGLALAGAAAQAQSKAEIERRYSRIYDRCVNGAGDHPMQGTGYANLDCSKGEMDRLDQVLNRTYRAKMARLAAPQKIALRQTQREWLRQRDQKCGGFEAAQALTDPTDESADPWCMMDETIRRTISLERKR
jgi:uncharacterized protein YecT (DUF1311 family)